MDNIVETTPKSILINPFLRSREEPNSLLILRPIVQKINDVYKIIIPSFKIGEDQYTFDPIVVKKGKSKFRVRDTNRIFKNGKYKYLVIKKKKLATAILTNGSIIFLKDKLVLCLPTFDFISSSANYHNRVQFHAYFESKYLPVRKRNFRAGLTARAVQSLAARPSSFDLKAKIPFIYDQGDLGSCTANAICMCLLIEKGIPSTFLPSRLYLYYKERYLEFLNSQQSMTDSGADATDGLEVFKDNGVCSEATYPYMIQNFNNDPPPNCDIEAQQHKIYSFESVLFENLQAVIAEGFPVIVAIEIFTAFESDEVARTGVVNMPVLDTEQSLGYHEVTIIGYNDVAQRFTLVNSWGVAWGASGYFTLPYAYMQKYGSEFCIMHS
jgi:C1A family cysteine protease